MIWQAYKIITKIIITPTKKTKKKHSEPRTNMISMRMVRQTNLNEFFFVKKYPTDRSG
jgi:hypothetical protein